MDIFHMWGLKNFYILRDSINITYLFQIAPLAVIAFPHKKYTGVSQERSTCCSLSLGLYQVLYIIVFLPLT